ncbi:MAG: ATP-binding protein [Fimbriimonadaceae bacterium]
MSKQVHVRSHVARDLLQTAALFKHEKQVVWEYVSNSLQYVGQGTRPEVSVVMNQKEKLITITDNGRGMDVDDLNRFFTMHGVNADRQRGRPGRGLFGTGKSAAFGIADTLTVISVKRGNKLKATLTRAEVEACGDGTQIPVKLLSVGVKTFEPDGTVIVIENCHQRTFDVPNVVRNIERHISRSFSDALIFVNGTKCEPTQPTIARTYVFETESEDVPIIGQVRLTICTSPAPLEPDARGIAISSNNVLQEVTLGSCEGKPMSEYMFGYIDVPKLDQDDSVPPPFDQTRSLLLNRRNALVQSIFCFIDPKLELIRKNLADDDAKSRKSAEMKRLALEAKNIASVINDDFNAYEELLLQARSRDKTKGDGPETKLATSGVGIGVEPLGTGAPGKLTREGGTEGDGAINQRDWQRENPDGNNLGEEVNVTTMHRKKRPTFGVEFKHNGETSERAVYVVDQYTIYINLDHPQLAALLKGQGPEDPEFVRFSYEIAFTEYAIALASMLEQKDFFREISDPIVEIRKTINRIARIFAQRRDG